MPRILVLYATTDGQTAKIAEAIGDTLRTAHVDSDVFDAGARAPGPGGYDAVIVAASVHAAGYQRAVRSWLREHVRELGDIPTAFVSVCLGVLEKKPAVDRELQAILDRFLTATGWRPTTIKVVAGALKYTQYNWLKRWAMRRIVQKAHGDTDTSRDYEYTDWEDLRTFAKEFARRVASEAA
jgi:menaquinone-dependent protoporphyrinogen oxidase